MNDVRIYFIFLIFKNLLEYNIVFNLEISSIYRIGNSERKIFILFYFSSFQKPTSNNVFNLKISDINRVGNSERKLN